MEEFNPQNYDHTYLLQKRNYVQNKSFCTFSTKKEYIKICVYYFIHVNYIIKDIPIFYYVMNGLIKR